MVSNTLCFMWGTQITIYVNPAAQETETYKKQGWNANNPGRDFKLKIITEWGLGWKEPQRPSATGRDTFHQKSVPVKELNERYMQINASGKDTAMGDKNATHNSYVQQYLCDRYHLPFRNLKLNKGSVKNRKHRLKFVVTPQGLHNHKHFYVAGL